MNRILEYNSKNIEALYDYESMLLEGRTIKSEEEIISSISKFMKYYLFKFQLNHNKPINKGALNFKEKQIQYDINPTLYKIIVDGEFDRQGPLYTLKRPEETYGPAACKFIYDDYIKELEAKLGRPVNKPKENTEEPTTEPKRAYNKKEKTEPIIEPENQEKKENKKTYTNEQKKKLALERGELFIKKIKSIFRSTGFDPITSEDLNLPYLVSAYRVKGRYGQKLVERILLKDKINATHYVYLILWDELETIEDIKKAVLDAYQNALVAYIEDKRKKNLNKVPADINMEDIQDDLLDLKQDDIPIEKTNIPILTPQKEEKLKRTYNKINLKNKTPEERRAYWAENAKKNYHLKKGKTTKEIIETPTIEPIQEPIVEPVKKKEYIARKQFSDMTEQERKEYWEQHPKMLKNIRERNKLLNIELYINDGQLTKEQSEDPDVLVTDSEKDAELLKRHGEKNVILLKPIADGPVKKRFKDMSHDEKKVYWRANKKANPPRPKSMEQSRDNNYREVMRYLDAYEDRRKNRGDNDNAYESKI